MNHYSYYATAFFFGFCGRFNDGGFFCRENFSMQM